jgi:ribokinase
LHDFFVDRLLFSRHLELLLHSVEAKGAAGGGGVHGVHQVEVCGGNAVNLARALTCLGTRTYLITHTDPAHETLLKAALCSPLATLSVKPLEPGLTVAFEGHLGKRRVNVMLGHLGGAGSFSPRLLNHADWDAMKRSKIVCTVNWAANRDGTELLREIRRRAGRKVKVFLDPADVRDRIPQYRALLRAAKKEHFFDWLSANEHEARTTARLLGVSAGGLDHTCRCVARELSVRFDLHTENGSFTSDGSEVVSHAVKPLIPQVVTGAGDVWDAASIHFFLSGYSDAARIELADLVAGSYVSSKAAQVPSETEVLSLLKHA